MLRKEGDKDLTDTEGSSTWAKLTQKGIDVIWFKFTNDMEEEVHWKYRVNKDFWCKKEVNRPHGFTRRRDKKRERQRQGRLGVFACLFHSV